ncbi:MAG: hypothetical protein KF886_25030 [Candidatus Hydrogenedentes bacterium]|nr:hypothetical protein [Candidatus Hydrogenedentota bacterium]
MSPFLSWLAPGTLIDGSGEPEETFTVTGAVTVAANEKPALALYIHDGIGTPSVLAARMNEPVMLAGGASWQGNWGPGLGGGTHETLASPARVWPSHSGPLLRGSGAAYFPQGRLRHVDRSSGGGHVAMGHECPRSFLGTHSISSATATFTRVCSQHQCPFGPFQPARSRYRRCGSRIPCSRHPRAR